MREGLKLCFKGNRNYIHGTDVYTNVLKYIPTDDVKNLLTLELQIHHIIKHGLTLVINENLPSSTEIAAYMHIKTEKGSFNFALIENQEEISCRYDYDEKDIVRKAEFNRQFNSISLRSYNENRFIERVVALNKDLLQKLFPQVEGKWYFTKIKLNRFISDTQIIEEIELHLKKNLNFKLTQTAILVDSESVGFIYFSLV